ncbi:hypothetical protein GGI05_003171, partial [Coemansia sp. RSA 2603]
YAMVINTPRLCADPMFYDNSASATYTIKCQNVLSEHRYKLVMAERNAFEKMQLAAAAEEQANKADTMARDEEMKTDVDQTLESSNGQEFVEEDDVDEEGVDSAEDMQLVISFSDPLKAAKFSKERKEILQQLVAAMYGDDKVEVEFKRPSKAASKPHSTTARKTTKVHDEL